MIRLAQTIACVLTGLLAYSAAAPCLAAQQFTGAELVLDEFLLLPKVGRYGRVPIHVDPLQASLANETWRLPEAGIEVTASDGNKVSWSAAQSDRSGWLLSESLLGGYAYTEVDSPRRQVVVLEASGHAMLFVNGEPRAGDPYLTSRTITPIVLKQGKNELLFHGAAGKLHAKLSKPRSFVFLDTRDMTVPDVVPGRHQHPLWAAILVVNCQEQSLKDCKINIAVGDTEPQEASVVGVPPLGVRKVPVPIDVNYDSIADRTRLPVKLSLNRSITGVNSPEVNFELAVKVGHAPQTHTFQSQLDHSIQHFELLPAGRVNGDLSRAETMLVSLHDTGESSNEHIKKFTPLANTRLIVPSGRRTEGCDWEDWSARDALEATEQAIELSQSRGRPAWLRGTGAGGHGVLRLGGISAPQWAALVARKPWLEYPAEPLLSVDTPLERILERVAASNQIVPLLSNTVGCGILLEDAGNDKGPSTVQSQTLTEMLKQYHSHFEFRDTRDRSFKNVLSEELRFCEKFTSPDDKSGAQQDCVTFNPGDVSSSGWLSILGQIEQGSLSRAAVRFDPEEKLFFGLTVNVSALAIDPTHLESDTVIQVVLDGEPVGEFPVGSDAMTFVYDEDRWRAVPEMPGSFKRPERYGGLRSAFENQATLVYGTQGSPQENAWALAKARYDAETLLVRANGSAIVVADTAFQVDRYPQRNVVLYGNANTNSVWPKLLSMSPVQVRSGSVSIDRRPEQGGDLACVFVRPRRGSRNAVVGVIGGTGIQGMRATDRLPYFVNGTRFPDLMLFSAKSLIEGNADVRAAGYFGTRWRVEPGEIVWRDSAL